MREKEKKSKRIRITVYLVELIKHKKEDLLYHPFVIWQCLNSSLEASTNHIEMYYGKIKTVWKCESLEDAEKWREEILKMRNNEDLI